MFECEKMIFLTVLLYNFCGIEIRYQLLINKRVN